MVVTTAENPIGDGLLITAGMFFGLRAIGVGQHDALLTSTFAGMGKII